MQRGPNPHLVCVLMLTKLIEKDLFTEGESADKVEKFETVDRVPLLAVEVREEAEGVLDWGN